MILRCRVFYCDHFNFLSDFLFFKSKLFICTLCIYNEVKVQLDDDQFVS